MKVLKSFIWKILQQYSTAFLKLIFQVILARILSPNEFGILAEMLVFISVAEAFSNGGLGTALIQNKKADELDFGTAIVSSFLISIAFYFVVFFTAPRIANFYDEKALIELMRVFGLAIPFYSFNSIQNAFLLKKYETKVMFISSFSTTLLSGVIAVFFALKGCGAFSLVLQNLLSMVGNVMVLQILSKWRPKIMFSKDRFKALFSFSWKIVVSGVFASLLENIYSLFIGKSYNSEILGYYNRGNSFPSTIIGQLRIAISAVTLPYFSDNQDNRKLLILNIKKITHLSVLIIFPVAVGLAVISEPLIQFLLTDKWLPCVFFLRLECIFYGFLPIATSVGNGMISVGRSDLSLKIEGIKFILTILTLSFVGTLGIEVICVCRIAISLIIILISVLLSRKVIGYGFIELIDDIWKPFVLSLAMGMLCYCVGLLINQLIIKLVIQITVGFISYGVGVIIFMQSDLQTFRALIMKHTDYSTD